MHRARTFLLAALSLPCAAFVLFACGREAPPPNVPPPTTALPTAAFPVAAPSVHQDPNRTGPDEAALDRSVSPCDDVYQFACGGWMKATPIPEDEASWVRSFSVLHEDNLKALRAILERDAQGDTRGDPYGAELGALWASCMDEPAIEKRGLYDLKPELERVQAVRDSKSLVQEIAHLHTIGVSAGFGFDSEIDMKDTERMIAGISQDGLGLPERDYYFRDDQRTKDIRAAYEKHVARTLELFGENAAQAAVDAKTAIRMETDLAGASMTNVELRDPQKIYHLVNLDGLKGLAPDLSWDAYLAGVGFPSIAAINVAQPEFVKKVDALVAMAKWPDWRVYLRWHLARSVSPILSQKFVDEWFHFRQILTGTKVLQPRWKRCVGFADQMMGEALAQPFVKDHLGEDGKRTAEQMVAAIEASMKADLDALPWMDDTTRTRAEGKLAKIVNKIGFPAKWRSYEGLAIDRASFVENIESATRLEVKRRLGKVGKPVDKEEWEMTPPTVNAYYEPTLNEMVFPAGILQSPFYSKTQTPGLNFGGIGMVVGHELTHGFDDEGRQFDAQGNLRDWWTAPVSAEFDRRASCVEKQYDEYVATDDLHIKGKLTLGENIADLGGLKLSFAAFERAEKENGATPSVGGFTPEQQFFLGFAQSWCATYRPEALRLLVATNRHSPPKYRVNGPLSNLPELGAAFQCKEGSPMVRSKEKRCEVW
ncbi:MAG TPA: M13 family metallopeptidase [Polyangiaceae bacterium]|nr:M13 family metallopeptidase [Polyangiaceae bacterium]